MSKLYVGQVVPSLEDPNAGPTYSITYLAQALEAQGCRSVIYCVGKPAPGLPSLEIRTSEREVGALMQPLCAAKEMALSLEAGQENVLHAHGLWLLPEHYSAVASRKRAVPLVISPRGMLSSWAMSHHKWRKRVIWQLWQRRDILEANALHVTSEQEAEDCRRVEYRGPLALIRNGVMVPPSIELEKRKRVVFLSRLHKVKGLNLLVEAWSRLEPNFPEWSLAIAGPDEDGSGKAAEEQAAVLGCRRVEFVGPLHGDAKSRFLGEAGLFVLPTHSENFGIAIAEAMAHGLPVVTTTGTPWSEVVARGVGWWIELSVENLANALREAMTLPLSELGEKGAKARQWMETDFSWNRVGHDMLELYRWLLGQAERPPFVILG